MRKEGGEKRERREKREESDQHDQDILHRYKKPLRTRSAGTEEGIMEVFGCQRGGMVQEGFGAAE